MKESPHPRRIRVLTKKMIHMVIPQRLLYLLPIQTSIVDKTGGDSDRAWDRYHTLFSAYCQTKGRTSFFETFARPWMESSLLLRSCGKNQEPHIT